MSQFAFLAKWLRHLPRVESTTVRSRQGVAILDEPCEYLGCKLVRL